MVEETLRQQSEEELMQKMLALYHGSESRKRHLYRRDCEAILERLDTPDNRAWQSAYRFDIHKLPDSRILVNLKPGTGLNVIDPRGTLTPNRQNSEQHPMAVIENAAFFKDPEEQYRLLETVLAEWYGHTVGDCAIKLWNFTKDEETKLYDLVSHVIAKERKLIYPPSEIFRDSAERYAPRALYFKTRQFQYFVH